MSNALLSTRTESYTVAHAYFPSDKPVGTVVTKALGLIKLEGCEAREYQIWLHEGCEGEGYKFAVMEAWSDDVHCTGCDLYQYNGVRD